MTALLLCPHNDDETLFASFTILRHQPDVVTCLRSYVQEQRGGPNYLKREDETVMALAVLGSICRRQQLPVRDDTPDPEMLTRLLAEIRHANDYDVVFAPAVEDGGHDHHNLVGECALHVFGGDVVVPYLTYRRGSGKSRSGNEVPFEPGWPRLKLRAMAEYASQIELESTSFWFVDETLREWYA